MGVQVPGAREVEPEAELLRLVHDRGDLEHQGYRLVLDEVHQVQPKGEPPVTAHIVVTASRKIAADPGLGARIAAAVRESWTEGD